MLNRRTCGGSSNRAAKRRSFSVFRAVENLEARLFFSTYTVTGTGDGAGVVTPVQTGVYTATTLRAAVTAADAAPDADVINFASGASGTITLSSALGELPITNPLSIQGPGASHLAVDGGGAIRVFSVAAGVTASISGLTISGGHTTVQGGAGVRNLGTLTLSNDTIANNLDTLDGAGVFNTGNLTVIGSTFSGNTAADGGGGLFTAGVASVVNSTFANNSADFGGAIYNASGSTLTVNDSTISGNHANSSGGGVAATLNDPTTMASGTRLNNTIVAGNTFTPFTTPNPNVAQNADLYGFFDAASSNNLIGSLGAAKGLIASINLLGNIANLTSVIDAKLSPLAYNGGTTQTMLPLAGSPAIDAGSNSLVPAGITADQRGMPRIFNTIVDIGAVETNYSTTGGGTGGTGGGTGGNGGGSGDDDHGGHDKDKDKDHDHGKADDHHDGLWQSLKAFLDHR